MGARSKDKAIAAIQEIQEKHPSANIHFLDLNLSNFSSVIAAAKKIRDEETELHGLVNNAGIMGVPYSVTADGYEIQLQVRYRAIKLPLRFNNTKKLSGLNAFSRPITYHIGS